MAKNEKVCNNISFFLLVLGGLCWGLLGLFQFDLIGSIFNTVDANGDMMMSTLTRIIFVLFGLAALYRLYLWIRACK